MYFLFIANFQTLNRSSLTLGKENRKFKNETVTLIEK